MSVFLACAAESVIVRPWPKVVFFYPTFAVAAIPALGKLLLLWEAYPDLKADDAAARLMEELASAENRIAFARQAYNDAVMGYNTAGEVFPANLLSGMFGFGRASLYELEDDAERAVPSARID